MRIGRRFKFTADGRLILLTAAIVALPVLVLSAIQYRSLADLKAKTEIAGRDNLSRALRVVSRRVEERMAGIAREVLAVGDTEELKSADLGRVENHFGAVRRKYPFVEQIFVVSHCECRERYALLSTATDLRRLGAAGFKESHELRHITHDFEAAMNAPPADTDYEFIFWQPPCPNCKAVGTEGYGIYIFKPFYEPGNDAPTGFAGFSVRADYIRRHFFTDLVAPAVANEAGWDELVFSVSDESGARVISSGETVDYEAEASLSPSLPRWKLAAGYKGTTAASLARAHFNRGLLITVSVLCCLTLGIILILRATFREMKLAESKSAFVSNVSHELKTPLALIRLFAETLELGHVRNEAKAREYYRIISRESSRLTGIIDNILDFSKIEAGRKEYLFAKTDVGEIVKGVLRDYEHRLETAGFELESDIGSDLPAVMADRSALVQAVLNLLDNAVKYSSEFKSISVRVYARRPDVIIEVTDRGIGIPRSEHEKIFDKFYRISTGLVQNTKGSGLGLSLVNHIVRAHSGRISLDSEPGRGSRFTIHLPAAAPEDSAGSSTASEVSEVAENTHSRR